MPLLFTGCAGLPRDFDRPESHAIRYTETSRLSENYAPLIGAHPGRSGLLPLQDGLDALAARLTLISLADRSIDAQYYLIHNDLTSRLFLNALIRAADRGVRVRLLVDDMAMWGRTKGAAMLSAHPRIEVRIFNPFSRGGSRTVQMIYRFGSVTRRMHNKAFIADNQAAILGGRNIGNEYFEADPDIEFGDMDVLTVGPVVDEVSVSFDKYWNSELAYPAAVLKESSVDLSRLASHRQDLEDFIQDQQGTDYVKALESSELVRQIKENQVPFFWGKAVALYDEPEKISAARDRTDIHLSSRLFPHFGDVEDELIIFSPYFVPGKQGVAYLAALCKSGVRVRVLTNSLASTDVALVHAGYSRYREDLLRAGIELYELDKKLTWKEKRARKGKYGASKASLHTKSFVLDRKRVFIGSLNLDPRSIVENTEIGVVLESPEIGGAMGRWFDENVEKIAFSLKLRENRDAPDQIRWHRQTEEGETVYIRDPRTSLFKRLTIEFLGLLPIESQL
ncbi:MAG: phospholipase D family protein [Desulfobacterales bacterium]|nr:phospholipase D family protein [Desulfobacterales bacterium]